MRKIWKYDIVIRSGKEDFYIPKKGKIVHVDCQQPKIVSFWVEFEDEYEKELRRFAVYGTGHLINEEDTYIGTTIDGIYVWHLYEKEII